MDCAIATNGYLINEEIANEMMYCKWVAISVDAASRETFKKVHGVDGWDKVIENIGLLVKTKKETGSDVAIDYRFLITPDNWKEISEACYVAKCLGVDAYHVRPADLERPDVKMKASYDTVQANRLLVRCHKYDDDAFSVYTTTHKFGKNFEVIHPFKKCVASPLVLQACADGNAYVCPDHRIEDRFRMCKTMDIRDYWGTDAHRELLQSIDVDKECSRCTWGSYQEQIEKLGSDPMHQFFP
jgi:MoaA/NifB/PqqE/SkfB family radical SAM enzyme